MIPDDAPVLANLPEPLEGTRKYYFIRSGSPESLQMSISKAVWATTIGNTEQLKKVLYNVWTFWIVY